MQLCPLGTYNPSQGMAAESDCFPCDPGYYCNATGLSAISGEYECGDVYISVGKLHLDMICFRPM